MLYRKNMKSWEQGARLLGGAAMVAFALLQHGFTPPALPLALAGVLTGLTGLVGFCPACALVGRKPVEGPG